MKTGMKVFLIIAIALLLVVTLASAAVSAFAFINTKNIKTAVDDIRGQYDMEDPQQEDDVRIAGEYYIRSTLPISDAYKSGDTSALDDRQKETLKMASDILDEIIEEGMTPFEKEKAVYEWLTTKLKSSSNMLIVIPESDEDCDNPYGVLKNRNAVCVGYATTFRLFMQMMDIECMVVHDTSTTHSWDLVKLDGEWYHTDCYFDSDEGNYRGFNVSDEILGQDHSWNRSFFPKAEGKKYNYALMCAEEVEDLYAIPAYVKNALDEEKNFFAVKVKDGIAKEDEPIANLMIQTVSEAVNATMSGSFQYYWNKDTEDNYVLSMFYNDYSGSEDPSDIPDDVYEKINQAVEDAFGEYSYYYDYSDDFIVGNNGFVPVG